jgi:endoribonuclease Dicer
LASIYVFVTNPSLSEGALHVARQKIISNKSLLVHSTRIGLPAYIQSKVFAYKTWLPPKCRVYIPPKPPKEPEIKSSEQSIAGDKEDDKEDEDSAELQKDLGETTIDNNTDISIGEAPAAESFCGTGDGSPMINSGFQSLVNPTTPVAEPGEIIEEDTFSDTGDQDQEPSVSRPATPPPALTPYDNASELVPKTKTMSKKKAKGRNKKPKTDEKGIQWLGDKVSVLKAFTLPQR